MSDALIKKFYDCLWGDSTSYRSIWYNKKGLSPTKNKWFTSTNETLNFVNSLDKSFFNVYHSCSLFKTTERKKQKTEYVKAVWLDLDLKGTSFTSTTELLKQLKNLKNTQFGCLPWVVFSGNGYHLYWMLDNYVTVDEWLDIAKQLFLTTQQQNLQVDHARTRDIASILRVPGTYNLKNEAIKRVKIIAEGDVLNTSKFVLQNKRKVKYDKNDFNLNNTLQQLNFLKSDINLAVEKCNFLKEFQQTGFHGNEPAWHLALTVTRCCVDGDLYAHQLSAQDKNYNVDETSYKLEQLAKKDIRPALCETLEKFGYCKDCIFKDKIKSPIQLGVVTTPIKNAIDGLDVKKEKDRAKELIALAPATDWIVGQEGIYRLIDDIPILVCVVPFYIIDLLCEDFSDETLITAVIRAYRNEQIETFKIPLKYVAEDRKLLAEFNGRRIFPANKKYLKEYIATYVMNLNQIKPQRSIVSLGWQKNDSFVYNANGDCFLDTNKPVNCILDRKMIGYATGFEQKGSIEKWKKGFEFLKEDVFKPHLFSILCSFGAPLLPFTSAKGFILSLQGSSGSGKTLAHKYAMSVWGNPETAGCLGTYDTHKAILGRLAVVKNLPLRLDEATLLKPQQLTGLIYELVNGRGRSRATVDGSLSNTSSEWQTLTLVTTNRPILENELTVISEAERCRVLELAVDMPANIVQTGQQLGAIMEQNFGVAGEMFITHLLKYKKIIIELLKHYQSALQKYADDDKRFWVTCGAIALTSAAILRTMRLLDIDLKKLQEWFVQTLENQQLTSESNIIASRGFKTREEFIHVLYDFLSGNLLVMNNNFITIEKTNREIKGRVVQITESSSYLYVTTPIVKEFIKKHFTESYEKTLKDFDIEPAKVRRFGLATVRCLEFKL